MNNASSGHPVEWLLNDAVELYAANRRPGCLLFLLCAIDGLAALRFPGTEKSNRARFTGFLKELLPAYTRITNFNVRVNTVGETLRIEEILYKFMRNPMVHEGSELRLDSLHAVRIDWTENAPSLRTDESSGAEIVGGVWIANQLAALIKDEIAKARR